LYVTPEGKKDLIGQYWNATDACCDYSQKTDDVAYLTALLDDVAARYNVDPKRVYLTGHSNGAFMSHRLACELGPRIAAIVAFSGDNWKDESKCRPADPVAVLQIHGTKDSVIKYGGGTQLPPLGSYPPAQ